MMIDLFRNEILHGNVLDKLKELDEESVHCCVTSPPYYGVRDYGTNPQIWAASKGENCTHEFVNIKTKKIDLTPGNPEMQRPWRKEHYKIEPTQSGFCIHCGAWKGELGLEPTPELYVEHLVQIFREVKRVLRKDGTCWLNLGDSYWGSGNASGHTEETENFGRKTNSYGTTKGHTVGKHTFFPEKLVEPCVLAGTSEHGVCAECGAPYERVLEKVVKRDLLKDADKQYRSRATEHQIVPVDQPNLGSVDKIPRSESANKFYTNTSTAGRLATYRQGARAYDAKYHTNEEGLFLNASERSITIQSEREESKTEAAELYPDDFEKQQWYINYVHEHGRMKQSQTIGWRKTCKCETNEAKPAIVLDPFFGAGTTGLVARKGNRDFIGIELNEKYIEIAKKRLAAELEPKLL
ncbi:MAG: DNA methyltransferase [Candidatus Doudnabacteria bacterium]